MPGPQAPAPSGLKMTTFTCVPSTVSAAQGQCPTGYAETQAQVIVAFDAEPPAADVAASVFALGFLAAFSTARVMAMVIRAVIALVKD